jgi:hypothetical protein
MTKGSIALIGTAQVIADYLQGKPLIERCTSGSRKSRKAQLRPYGSCTASGVTEFVTVRRVTRNEHNRDAAFQAKALPDRTLRPGGNEKALEDHERFERVIQHVEQPLLYVWQRLDEALGVVQGACFQPKWPLDSKVSFLILGQKSNVSSTQE